MLLNVYAEVLEVKISELLDMEYEDFTLDFEWTRGKRLAEFINSMEIQNKSQAGGAVNTKNHKNI